MTVQIHTCCPGTEHFAARELAGYGAEHPHILRGGIECRVASPWHDPVPGLCYPFLSAMEVETFEGASVNSLADRCCGSIMDMFRDVQLDTSWYLGCISLADESAMSWLKSVRKECLRRLGRRMGRVAGLVTEHLPVCDGSIQGCVIVDLGENRCAIGTQLRSWGQRRMRQAPGAPSRSYLKLEEAFAIFGNCPESGDLAVDLGAAPGGWSYSVAARGAEVIAVDNGPLKGGAARHRRILHLRQDAFTFRPQRTPHRVDWLLCDLIEDPYRVVEEILFPWVRNRWCRHFVVNLKTGKRDPVELIRKLSRPGRESLTAMCSRMKVRRLFHDRDEITCMGDAAT